MRVLKHARDIGLPESGSRGDFQGPPGAGVHLAAGSLQACRKKVSSLAALASSLYDIKQCDQLV